MAMAISGLHFRAVAVAAHSSSNTSNTCNSRSTRVCCSREDDSRFLRREAAARVVLATIFCNSAPSFLSSWAVAAEEEPKLTVLDSGLGFCDTRVGVGNPGVNGSYVKVHYTGKREDGTQFESSYTFNRPLEFRLGVGEVIDGWDRGILGGNGIPPMQPGGRRLLQIPASMAFGEEGVGCKKGKPLLTLLKSYFNPGKSSNPPAKPTAPSCFIAPNATLFFDVELLEAFELPKSSKDVKKKRR
ncbi:peptidyl-prolyl cis-trans isomerase FKBP13, chloroplastic [Selaginella moellendorffii]|nr:peptidyl-prolyl cis-trans isomerase FKBP13, chloroplastic [Selaginella moellendorffii]|eukprot:XP_002970171.2 peptidyl-prolyl cis-trans isomerase FKBP13, chloroplastic [Selaginella moellendorffii]